MADRADDIEEPDDQPGKAGGRALAYEASLRYLADQRDDLERMRTRSAGMVTVALAVASFLVGASFSRDRVTVEAADPRLVAGFVAVAAVVGIYVYLLIPRTWWFHNDPQAILEDFAEEGWSASQAHFYLATYNGRHARENEPLLGRRSVALAIAGVLTFIEVALLSWFFIALS
jgi:hypothetical protein